MRHRPLPLVIALFVCAGLSVPGLVSAQGNGRPKAPKAPTTTTPTTTTSTSTSSSTPTTTTTAAAPVALIPSTFRQFGAWLDDASAPGRGVGYTTIGIGHWRMSGSSQTNYPMLGAGLGISDRMQVSASVPFYHTNYQGMTASGMDDMYLGAKYTVIDPTLTVSEFGLAVSPVMEVLSAGSPDGRVHFAVPVSVALHRQPYRIYGSAGYFTRGSVFSGAALEWSSNGGMTVTGTLTQSYSLKEDTTLDALGMGRRRADAGVGIAHPIGGRAAGFVNVGRSLTSLDEGGTSLALNGGIVLHFSMSTSQP